MNERRGWSHAGCFWTLNWKMTFGFDRDHWGPWKENNDGLLREEIDAVGSEVYEHYDCHLCSTLGGEAHALSTQIHTLLS